MHLTLFDFLDYTGTIAFAVSGALVGMNKRLDIFGVFIVCFATALGGGTLRDVLIGKTPVMWMQDISYVYCVTITFVFTIIFRKYLDKLRKSMLFFDTLGLGIFTLIGLQRGMSLDLHPAICIALGTMTATFGGVIRDILCNQIPVLFKEEIYATPCIIGGFAYFIMNGLQVSLQVNYVVTTLIIISIRFLAIRYKWSLPKFSPEK
jgi:uncharacterized membrane protein YeiH